MNHISSDNKLNRKGLLGKRLDSVLRAFVLMGVFAGIGAPAWADVTVDTTAGTITGDGAYANAIALTANTTVTPTSGNTITLNGAVSGAFGLTLASDNLTLSGGYSCSGATTVNGGTLNFQKLAASGTWGFQSSEFNINNGSTLQFDVGVAANNQIRFQTAAGNKFTFDSNGGGTLNTGTNLNLVLDYATTFTTNGGAKNQITGASGFNFQTTGAITFNVAKGTDEGGVDLDVSATLWNNNGTVVKTGAGTLVLSGANTYTKGTTISAGMLKITGTMKTSGFDIAKDATLVIDTTAGGRDFGASQTFTGSGTFIKTGANNLVWGSAIATFAMDAGSEIRIEVGTFTGGSYGNENWTNNKSSLYVANGATFSGVEANVRMDALNGNGTIMTGYNGSGYQNFTFGVAGGSGTFSGTLKNSDGTTGNFVKEGTGKQILAGNNTYTGTTTINGGTLDFQKTGNGNLYLTTSEFIINNGSTLEFEKGVGNSDQFWFQAANGNKFTFGSAGGGTINTGTGLNLVLNVASTTFTTSGGAKNQIIGASGFNFNFADAVITFDVAKGTDPNGVDLEVSAPQWNGGSGVTKTGEGTMVLSGDGGEHSTQLYTKGTTISAGTLKITGNTASSSFDIASGATLEIAKSHTLSRTFSGAGTLKLTGDGTSDSHFDFAGATIADFSGLTSIEGARVRIGSKTFPGGVSVSNNGQLYVQDGTVDAALTIAGIGTHEGEGDLGAVRLQNGTLTGSVTLSDNASMMAYGGTGTVNSTIDLAGHALTISQGNVDKNRRDFTLNGIISDSSTDKTGTLVLDLSKTTTISGTNTYSGGTTLKQGTVVFSNDSAFGTGLITLEGGNFQQSGGRTLANDIAVTGTVAFTLGATQNMTLNGNLTGSGTINRSGSYTLMLYGDNSGFTGTLNANESNTYLCTAAAGSANATWNIGVTLSACLQNTTAASVDHISLGAVTGSGTLRNDKVGLVIYDIGGKNLTGDDTPTFSGTITNGYAGAIGINKVGTGTQILSGNNTYTGTTTISGGILVAGSATALGNSSSLTVAQGASFVPYENMTFTGKYSAAGNQDVILTVTESPALGLSVNTLLTGGNLTLADSFAFNITSTPGMETGLFPDWEVVSNYLKDADVSLLELTSAADDPDAMRDTISVLTARNLFDPASGAFFYALWNADGGAGNFGSYDLQVGVPEPSTWALLVLGAFGILGLRRRKR